jgi:hypothetical protein
VLTSYGDIVLGEPAQPVGRWVEPECLLYDHLGELQQRDVVGMRRPAGEHVIDLALHCRLHISMPTEQLHRERQRRRSRFMPGQQEDQDLVAYLLLAHRRAGLRIPCREQQGDEISTGDRIGRPT